MSRIPYSELQDDQVFQGCLERDMAALTELVTRYTGLVRSIVCRYCDAPADRDEMCQEIFLSVCHPRTLESLRDGNKLRYFVAAVARNKCRDWLKSRRDFLELDPDTIACNPRRYESLLYGWLELEEAIGKLPRTRGTRLGLDILRLRYLEDRTYREVGRTLNMPVGSIGPTLSRLFKEIRLLLREDRKAE